MYLLFIIEQNIKIDIVFEKQNIKVEMILLYRKFMKAISFILKTVLSMINCKFTVDEERVNERDRLIQGIIHELA